MKKYLLIYNPLSGDASFKNKLDFIISRFQKKNAIIIPYRTVSKEESRKFIAVVKNYEIDAIIAAGGDGTIHEVINSMMKNDINIPLGIIPSGTSNDFATYLNIKSFKKAIDTILNGNVKYVDIGLANDEYFLNVASAGFMTSVAHNVDPMYKNVLGKMAYYLKGVGELPNFRSFKVDISIDGDKIEDDIFAFLVMNSKSVASFPKLAPYAKVDDGKLDLMLIKKCNITDLMSLLISLLKGDHLNHKLIKYTQVKDVVIECDNSLESDLDGELGPDMPMHITVVSDKLRIFCD